MRKRCVIITGGNLPLTFARAYLQEAGFLSPKDRRQAADEVLLPDVIAADRGLVHCRALGIVPGTIVGDFDSAGEDVLADYRNREGVHIQTFPPEKDWTDTELAVNLAISFGYDRLDVLGGTGSRIDHVLGNVQTMELALARGAAMILADPNNRIRMVELPLTLKRDQLFGRFLSLIPWGGPVEGLSLEGVKYPLKNRTFPTAGSLGISNEAICDQVSITFTRGRLLIIESRDE